MSNLSKFRLKTFCKGKTLKQTGPPKRRYFVKAQRADGLSKDMIRNISRRGYAFLSLSQEWGTIFKAFLGKEQGQA